MTSDEKTEGRCNAKTRDGGFCANYPVEDSNRCRMHGGAANNSGKNNGNYKHGAYSKSDEAFRDSLTDKEQELYDSVREANEDPDTALGPIKTILSDLIIKYRRTGDHRFIREYRQLCSEFNIADNTDKVEHSGAVTQLTHELTDDQAAQLDEITGGSE